jgi:hypothetical protein
MQAFFIILPYNQIKFPAHRIVSVPVVIQVVVHKTDIMTWMEKRLNPLNQQPIAYKSRGGQ